MLVIGPGGVFTVATRNRPRGRAVVDSRCVRVNSQHTNHVRNARHEGTRTAWLLSEACHFSVPVTPLIVFVGLDDFKIKQLPDGVQVTTLDRLLAWFESRPAISSPATSGRDLPAGAVEHHVVLRSPVETSDRWAGQPRPNSDNSTGRRSSIDRCAAAPVATAHMPSVSVTDAGRPARIASAKRTCSM